MAKKVSKKKWRDFLILFWFLIVLGQFVFSAGFRLATDGPAQDFEVFYLAGKQVLESKNPYLKLAGDTIRNPPPSLFLFAPLALLPMMTSEVIYFIVSLTAFLVASFFLFKIIKKDDQYSPLVTWQAKTVYLGLALIFFPLRHNFASGQVNSFLLLLLTLAFYFQLKEKIFKQALMMALAIGLKLTPLVLLLPLLIQKRYKTNALIGLFLVLILLITSFFLGPKIWQEYGAVTASYFDLGIASYYNQAVTGFLTRIRPNLGRFFYFLFLILAGFSVLFLASRLKKVGFERSLILWNLAILAMVLLLPFVWQYHLTIIIFPLVMTVYLILKRNLSKRFWFLAGLSYLLLFLNIKNPDLFFQLGVIGALALSHATIGALILLIINLNLALRYRIGKLKKVKWKWKWKRDWFIKG